MGTLLSTSKELRSAADGPQSMARTAVSTRVMMTSRRSASSVGANPYAVKLSLFSVKSDSHLRKGTLLLMAAQLLIANARHDDEHH
eukprot:SAG31_NODE_220_length_19925_cov_3.630939_15_plen_86_part_00